MSRRDPEKIRREEEPHRVSAVEGTESRAGMPVPPGGQAEGERFYRDHRPRESHTPNDPKSVQTKGKEKMALMVTLSSEKEPCGSTPWCSLGRYPHMFNVPET